MQVLDQDGNEEDQQEESAGATGDEAALEKDLVVHCKRRLGGCTEEQFAAKIEIERAESAPHEEVG